MFCPYCGKSNNDGGKFCVYCGKYLTQKNSAVVNPKEAEVLKNSTKKSQFVLGYKFISTEDINLPSFQSTIEKKGDFIKSSPKDLIVYQNKKGNKVIIVYPKGREIFILGNELGLSSAQARYFKKIKPQHIDRSEISNDEAQKLIESFLEKEGRSKFLYGKIETLEQAQKNIANTTSFIIGISILSIVITYASYNFLGDRYGFLLIEGAIILLLTIIIRKTGSRVLAIILLMYFLVNTLVPYFVKYIDTTDSMIGTGGNLIFKVIALYLSAKLAQATIMRRKYLKEKGLNEREITNTSEMELTESKSSKKKWVWISVGVAVLLIIAGILFSSGIFDKDLNFITTDKNSDFSEQSGNLYRNTKYDFRIKFPEGWEIKSGDGPNIVQKAVSGNHTISVGVHEVSSELGEGIFTIKDAVSFSEFKDTILEGGQEKLPDATLLNAGELKLDNEPVYWIKYTAPYTATVEGTQIQYQLFKNNIFYFITAGSTSDEYLAIEPELMKSIATFVIKDY